MDDDVIIRFNFTHLLVYVALVVVLEFDRRRLKILVPKSAITLVSRTWLNIFHHVVCEQTDSENPVSV